MTDETTDLTSLSDDQLAAMMGDTPPDLPEPEAAPEAAPEAPEPAPEPARKSMSFSFSPILSTPVFDSTFCRVVRSTLAIIQPASNKKNAPATLGSAATTVSSSFSRVSVGSIGFVYRG